MALANSMRLSSRKGAHALCLVQHGRKSGERLILTRQVYIICVGGPELGPEAQDRGGEIALRRSSSPRTMFSP
jgi:hypothetical protein